MSRLVANDKSQVQVIARAATILRALEEENAGLSLGQIAQRVNLARSTVQRIVAALETEKLVIAAVTGWGQDQDRRRSAEAGFDHHFVKPMAMAELEGLLASLSPH